MLKLMVPACYSAVSILVWFKPTDTYTCLDVHMHMHTLPFCKVFRSSTVCTFRTWFFRNPPTLGTDTSPQCRLNRRRVDWREENFCIAPKARDSPQPTRSPFRLALPSLEIVLLHGFKMYCCLNVNHPIGSPEHLAPGGWCCLGKRWDF